MYKNMFALILLASYVSVATADNGSWTMAYDIPDNSPLHSLLEVTGKKAQYADSSTPDLVGNAVLVGPDLVLTCSHVWGSGFFEGIENSAEGKKGFAFNYASTSEGEFTEADIYEAEEVIFSIEDDFIGIDIAVLALGWGGLLDIGVCFKVCGGAGRRTSRWLHNTRKIGGVQSLDVSYTRT